MRTKEFTDLLVQARKAKGLTQEEVCQITGIAKPSTLSRWETGADIPSDKMMKKLVQAYDDPILGYIYLRSCTDLGQMILPPIIHAELDNLTLRFQKEYNDIRHVQMDMIDIACDGVVEMHESERWERARKEVEELASVSLPLVLRSFMKSKKPSQGGNLVRAYA